jgi:sugar phosphate permease
MSFSLRMQVLVATWLSYAGLYVTRKVFSVVKGPIKAALQLDDVGVSHVFTTYLVTYACGQFLSAWLSRRVSARAQLLVGMSTSVLCNVAMGVLVPRGPSAYDAILVVMSVHGLAQATGWPCNVSIMASWTRHKERGGIMAMWCTCYQLGSVGAKLMASLVFGLMGLAWSFWGAAIVLAGITALFFFWGHERPESCGLPPLEPDLVPAAAGSDDTADQQRAQRRQLTLVFAMGTIYFAFKFLRYVVDSWSALMAGPRYERASHRPLYDATEVDCLNYD